MDGEEGSTKTRRRKEEDKQLQKKGQGVWFEMRNRLTNEADER